MLLLLQPIPLGVTFSKAQSSKLERLVCHVSMKRYVRALSFETTFENVTPSGIGCTYICRYQPVSTACFALSVFRSMRKLHWYTECHDTFNQYIGCQNTFLYRVCEYILSCADSFTFSAFCSLQKLREYTGCQSTFYQYIRC